MKESINKSPKSAMELYIKIYCQKHDKVRKEQNALIEATKSWVSLNKSDKQYFLKVFNEYKTKLKKHFAANLQNAELYMKKSHNSKRLSKSKTTTVDYNHSINEDTDQINTDNLVSICKDEAYNEKDVQHQDEQFENHNTTIPVESVACVAMEPEGPRFISEPTPPIRSGMELFEMIKHNEESTKKLNWVNLTKLQKQRYQRALLTIKRNYIKQYTSYLEHLTSEQLFHHYKSKF